MYLNGIRIYYGVPNYKYFGKTRLILFLFVEHLIQLTNLSTLNLEDTFSVIIISSVTQLSLFFLMLILLWLQI